MQSRKLHCEKYISQQIYMKLSINYSYSYNFLVENIKYLMSYIYIYQMYMSSTLLRAWQSLLTSSFVCPSIGGAVTLWSQLNLSEAHLELGVNIAWSFSILSSGYWNGTVNHDNIVLTSITHATHFSVVQILIVLNWHEKAKKLWGFFNGCNSLLLLFLFSRP